MLTVWVVPVQKWNFLSGEIVPLEMIVWIKFKASVLPWD